MASRREIIRMTPDEIRSYLEGQGRIILVTIGPDGMPHPVPMNYGMDGEGRIIITSFRKSQKVLNLRRDPRATLLVESGDTYRELKSVIAYANAEIIEDPDTIVELMRLVSADRELADSIDTGMSEQVRASIAKRVVLRFTPYRQISWDHAKLSGFY